VLWKFYRFFPVRESCCGFKAAILTGKKQAVKTENAGRFMPAGLHDTENRGNMKGRHKESRACRGVFRQAVE
jgi:hypothetical protein